MKELEENDIKGLINIFHVFPKAEAWSYVLNIDM